MKPKLWCIRCCNKASHSAKLETMNSVMRPKQFFHKLNKTSLMKRIFCLAFQIFLQLLKFFLPFLGVGMEPAFFRKREVFISNPHWIVWPIAMAMGMIRFFFVFWDTFMLFFTTKGTTIAINIKFICRFVIFLATKAFWTTPFALSFFKTPINVQAPSTLMFHTYILYYIPYARHYNPRFVFFTPFFTAVYIRERFILQRG